MRPMALLTLGAALMSVAPSASFPADLSGTPRPRRMRRGARFGEHAADAEDLPAEDRERIARAEAKRARKAAARAGGAT